MIRSATGLSDHMWEAVLCQETGGMLIPATRGGKMHLESGVLVQMPHKTAWVSSTLASYHRKSEQGLCPQFNRTTCGSSCILRSKRIYDMNQKTCLFVLLYLTSLPFAIHK